MVFLKTSLVFSCEFCDIFPNQAGKLGQLIEWEKYFSSKIMLKIYLQNTCGWLFLLIPLFQPRLITLWWSHLFRLFLHVFAFIIDIVGKGIPGPSLFKAPTPWPSLSHFLKSLFTISSFLFHPLLRYFRQFPHPQTTPSCPNLTNQPSLV